MRPNRTDPKKERWQRIRWNAEDYLREHIRNQGLIPPSMQSLYVGHAISLAEVFESAIEKRASTDG